MTQPLDIGPDAIVAFWFSDRARRCWWEKDDDFDAEVRERFGTLHREAAGDGLPGWRDTARGRLAEIVVLDQLSRNLYRDSAEAFAQDELARKLAHEAIAVGADRELPPEQRAFVYLPLMHSESVRDHELAMALFASDPALADNLEFEKKHKAIIDRFGRYPHRNAALGRTSTEEERAFLEQPGSSF